MSSCLLENKSSSFHFHSCNTRIFVNPLTSVYTITLVGIPIVEQTLIDGYAEFFAAVMMVADFYFSPYFSTFHTSLHMCKTFH